MQDLLTSLGPALDLIGWVALIAAAGFYGFALAERRRDAEWKTADYEIAMLEGQECLVFHTSDGTVRSELLVLDSPRAPEGQALVYYRDDNTGSWQLEKPRSQVRFLYWTAAALVAGFVLSKVLGIIAHL
ncbi:hypothetical protein GCM10009715_03050 [Paeniglutamicibacter psychrophenolicus]|uniref:DUF3592 domain-containing protein n=1 Tax=Paeniglutamicibacter psychrophenolicus TaxID=257454 RepID=A0ABS4WAY9_9MICC|nr:hypothetical protein [Paeniglutamicibacter psychrophenolicus]MBP2373372.1 hypothetical protein [Paeniglutamicibacter psychrophenolicus]